MQWRKLASNLLFRFAVIFLFLYIWWISIDWFSLFGLTLLTSVQTGWECASCYVAITHRVGAPLSSASISQCILMITQDVIVDKATLLCYIKRALPSWRPPSHELALVGAQRPLRVHQAAWAQSRTWCCSISPRVAPKCHPQTTNPIFGCRCSAFWTLCAMEWPSP